MNRETETQFMLESNGFASHDSLARPQLVPVDERKISLCFAMLCSALTFFLSLLCYPCHVNQKYPMLAGSEVREMGLQRARPCFNYVTYIISVCCACGLDTTFLRRPI